MIMITLQQIRDAEICASGWRKVLDANGPDLKKPFKASSILDSNDIEDCLWVLRCLPEQNVLLRKFACWCALENIEMIKPYCSIDDYSLIFDYLNNPTDVASTTALVARAALAAADAALAADSATAATAAYAAANTPASYAVYAASRAAVDRQKQTDKLREILDAGEWVE